MSKADERFIALCEKHGLDPNAIVDVSKVPEKRKRYSLACDKLAIIAECYNKEDKDGNIVEMELFPDYANPRQWKYELLFDIVKDESSVSGFGLAYYGYGNRVTCTGCGGRLCWRSVATGKRAFADFPEYFEDFYLTA